MIGLHAFSVPLIPKPQYQESQRREKQKHEAQRTEARKKELSVTVEKGHKAYKDYFMKAIEAPLSLYSEEQMKEKQAEFIRFLETKHSSALSIKAVKKSYWSSAFVFPEAVEFFQSTGVIIMPHIDQIAQKEGIANYSELKQELEALK